MISAIFLASDGYDWSNCSDKVEVVNHLEQHLSKHAHELFDDVAINITCKSGTKWCVEIQQSKRTYSSADISRLKSKGEDGQKLEKLTEHLQNGRGYMSGVTILKVNSGACR